MPLAARRCGVVAQPRDAHMCARVCVCQCVSEWGSVVRVDFIYNAIRFCGTAFRLCACARMYLVCICLAQLTDGTGFVGLCIKYRDIRNKYVRAHNRS